LQILDQFFPDLLAALVDGGAVRDDFSVVAWHHFGVWKRQIHAGIEGMTQSRPYLEWHVRERVARLSNVSWLAEHRVTDLRSTGDRRQITGVCVTTASGAAEELSADLVVDASGRGSRMPSWLEKLGYVAPPVSEIKVGVGYATRMYRRTAFPNTWRKSKGIVVMPTPPKGKRASVLFAVEGDRWMCTLQGWLHDHPPVDDVGYLEFARSLPVSDVFDVISRCEPLSPIEVYKFPSSTRRHYERIAMPDRLLVVGDAACSFNPIYGQGMTVSALEAKALGDALGKARRGTAIDLSGLTRPLQRTMGKLIEVPWRMGAGEDLRYLDIEGHRSLSADILNGYVARIHRLVEHDEHVLRAFYRVMNMLAPPTLLLRPSVVARVLLQWRATSDRSLHGSPAFAATDHPPRYGDTGPSAHSHIASDNAPFH
jgi:2-polyprenyl-6-methoxyphenol hydroxylase-like FAD-dependent oxidoreductase